jgi:putative salt-induced outer membrane protein
MILHNTRSLYSLFLLYVFSSFTYAGQYGLPSQILVSDSDETQATQEIKSPFTTSAELGMLYKSGNTRSGDIKAALNSKYELGQWLSIVNFDFLHKKTEQLNSEGEQEYITTDRKWSITSQTNYSIEAENRNYIYANGDYEENDFGTYQNQRSFSIGWGQHLYKTLKSSLYADIGPGYKQDIRAADEYADKITVDTFIVQAQSLFIYYLNEHVEFRQLFIAKYAVDTDENSKYKAETSISTKLIDTLQLKVQYIVDHNTVVDSSSKKTDTQTAITFVYSF